MNIFILGRPRYLVAWRGETIVGGIGSIKHSGGF